MDLTDAIYILEWRFVGGPPPVPIQIPAGGAALIDTGVTTCRNESGEPIDCRSATCPGQDAVYPTGCTMADRFVDHGDGTITDLCTGLMWQQRTADVTGDGKIDDTDQVPWCESLAYCKDLNHAGYNDWRLPNVRELESLLDYSRSDPCT